MLFLSIILSIIIFWAICKVCVMWKQLQRCNQQPLDIKTFDGSDSPYHPAVLYFKDGWNGYKYWMAETPFSPKAQPYPDRFECPTIHVSNDGVNWAYIGEELKPIDDLTEQQVAAEQRKANAIAQAGAGLDKTFNKGLDLFLSPLKGKGE
jgi:hypothetical protein